MRYFIVLAMQSLVMAEVYVKSPSALLMPKLQAKAASITEYMADKINRHSSDLQKRGFIRNLKQDLKDYIDRTYTQKSLKSFEPIMKLEVDNGFSQYYDPLKGKILTPEQEKYRQQQFSMWLSKRLESKLKNHMMSEFRVWENDHLKLKKTKDAGLVKKETSSIYTRYVENTPKNMAIYGIVSAFLLIPIFMNPFTIGFYGLILSLISFMLFFDPILKRVIFGEWF